MFQLRCGVCRLQKVSTVLELEVTIWQRVRPSHAQQRCCDGTREPKKKAQNVVNKSYKFATERAVTWAAIDVVSQ